MMESLPVEMRRMIMEHFSNAELLKISLVNKLFNHEARSLMSTRGNLNADLGIPACQHVLPFVSHLKHMDVIPFSGIQIRWCSVDHSKLCSRPNKIRNPATLGILDRVAWKRLSVTMNGGQSLPKTCPALQLVQKVLNDFSAVLEELEMNNHPKLLRFIHEITQERKFPQLKTLKIEGPTSHHDTKGAKKSFMKDMIARAPNLREFHQDGPPHLSVNLLEGRSSVVLVSNYENFNPALHEFSEGFTRTVKMKQMNLYYTKSFSMQRFKRTVPRILQSSFETLRFIHINLIFLVPLMGHGGLCLKNLTDFSTYMDYDHWELVDPRILSLLKQFDFTRIFPKLNKVVLLIDSCSERISAVHIAEFVTTAVLEEPLPDRAMNIKDLSISMSVTPEAVSFLAEMFPHLETLSINIHRAGQQVPYSLIWKHWMELKELGVKNFSPYAERHENLDSDFCGIFPAEVALLREQDDEYLRAVHIVPVMPSITCLAALRTLRIVRRYKHCRCLREEMDPMFSKVTALIAFRRCPNFSVNIQTSC